MQPQKVFSSQPHRTNELTFIVGYQLNTDALIYVLARKFDELHDLSELMRNNRWRELVTNDDYVTMWILEVVGDDPIAVRRAWSKWIASMQPECNLKGRVDHVSRGMLIVCTSGPYVGETRNNQTEWCRFLKTSPSNMSNHVNRNPGFKTIKGCTFSPVIKGGLFHPMSQEYMRRSQLPEYATHPHYNGTNVQIW